MSRPTKREVQARQRAKTAMERFVEPYKGDLDPISAFEAEFRRTVGRIAWLEDQIAALEDEALIWGLTKEEDVTASEFAGVNRTYEARVHIYEEMLWKERKHLLEMEKVYFRTDIDRQRLGMMRQYLEGTYTATVALVRALGHDPNDPGVRDKIRRMFETGPQELR